MQWWRWPCNTVSSWLIDGDRDGAQHALRPISASSVVPFKARKESSGAFGPRA